MKIYKDKRGYFTIKRVKVNGKIRIKKIRLKKKRKTKRETAKIKNTNKVIVNNIINEKRKRRPTKRVGDPRGNITRQNPYIDQLNKLNEYSTALQYERNKLNKPIMEEVYERTTEKKNDLDGILTVAKPREKKGTRKHEDQKLIEQYLFDNISPLRRPKNKNQIETVIDEMDTILNDTRRRTRRSPRKRRTDSGVLIEDVREEEETKEMLNNNNNNKPEPIREKATPAEAKEMINKKLILRDELDRLRKKYETTEHNPNNSNDVYNLFKPLKDKGYITAEKYKNFIINNTDIDKDTFNSMTKKQILDSFEEILKDYKQGPSGKGMSYFGGLSNLQLEKYINKKLDLDRKFGFKGVYMSNEINKIKLERGKNGYVKPFCFIMNLDSNKKTGSHWVAININNKAIEYYNSLAGLPTLQVIKDIRKLLIKYSDTHKRLLKYNSVRDQRVNTDTCGAFSIKFLYDRYTGKSFKRASGYSSIEKAEKTNKILIRKIRKFTKYI